jgi:hypothetical protein
MKGFFLNAKNIFHKCFFLCFLSWNSFETKRCPSYLKGVMIQDINGYPLSPTIYGGNHWLKLLTISNKPLYCVCLYKANLFNTIKSLTFLGRPTNKLKENLLQFITTCVIIL